MRTLMNTFLGLLVLSSFVIAQDTGSTSPAKAADVEVSVPTFPNPTCTVMGKKTSLSLFVDTTFGRIYVCCKACNKTILKDQEAAHKASYPVIKKVGNATCPITGKKIEEGAPTVLLQGHEINVCCKECVSKAQSNSQLTLVKVLLPDVKDVGNKACPITGKAADPNTLLRIGDEVIRLASPAAIVEAKKDPKSTLEKAKSIAAEEKKAEKS